MMFIKIGGAGQVGFALVQRQFGLAYCGFGLYKCCLVLRDQLALDGYQGLPLDNALVDAVQGTLTCPWHGFCYDATTGECMTMPGAQLRPLPLRIEDGRVWVRAVGG